MSRPYSIELTVRGHRHCISRDVCARHSAEVHEALGTGGSESSLQHGLDQCYVGDWYGADGRHLGPDVNGLEMFWLLPSGRRIRSLNSWGRA